MNYIEEMEKNGTKEYLSQLYSKSLEVKGRKTYIFLLDKKDTEISDIYHEAIRGRKYLPHFELMARYKTNPFMGTIDVDFYHEKEDALEIDFSFDDMVKKIRSLKEKSIGKLKITNALKQPVEITKYEDVVFVNSSGTTIMSFNTKDESIENFCLALNGIGLTTEYSGDILSCSKFENFAKTVLPRRTIEVNLNDDTYDNVTDVIELGAVILTDKYKAYQVLQAVPENDKYGLHYLTWKTMCKTINLEKIDGLPEDFKTLIGNYRYETDKVEME